jgi:hypothetical protein
VGEQLDLMAALGQPSPRVGRDTHKIADATGVDHHMIGAKFDHGAAQ